MSFASVQNSNASFNNLFSNILTFSDGTSQTTAASGSSILTTNNTFTGNNTFTQNLSLSGNINMDDGDINTTGDVYANDATFSNSISINGGKSLYTGTDLFVGRVGGNAGGSITSTEIGEATLTINGFNSTVPIFSTLTANQLTVNNVTASISTPLITFSDNTTQTTAALSNTVISVKSTAGQIPTIAINPSFNPITLQNTFTISTTPAIKPGTLYAQDWIIAILNTSSSTFGNLSIGRQDPAILPADTPTWYQLNVGIPPEQIYYFRIAVDYEQGDPVSSTNSLILNFVDNTAATYTFQLVQCIQTPIPNT
jgi:hypothetical protein